MDTLNKQQMAQHITIVGWLHIINGLFALVVGALLFLFLNGIGVASGDEQAIMVLGVVATFVSGLLVILGLPGLVAGFGVLTRKTWARYLTIGLSVLNLFNVPVGTLIGVYTLWVLMQENAALYFEPEPAALAH